jgi:signal transduction histidine kinase
MKKINIHNKIENDIFIKTISINLEVILNNILSNSIKYTPKNGMITIDYCHDDINHIIIIIDNGIGIDKSQIENFHNEINDPYSTGFGLHICKELIQK